MLIKTVGKQIFGTAISGFGLSLGRSTYNKTTSPNAILVLLALMIVFGVLYAFYFNALTFFRNYRSWFWGTVIRVTNLAFWFLSFSFVYSIYLSELEKMDTPNADATITRIVLFGLPTFLTFAGMIRGLLARRKRKLYWETEVYNTEFLSQHNLIEDDDHVTDNEGQKYRLENVTQDYIELFPLGRRGKRAYLTFDEVGKFQEWTGMVKV